MERPSPSSGGERSTRPMPLKQKRLSINSMNFAIPTNACAEQHVEEKHGKDSWKLKVLLFLHSSKIQLLITSLLFLDVVILFVEVFLLAEYPHCNTIQRDAISCCPVMDDHTGDDHATEDSHARFLSESDHHEDFCGSGLEAAFDYEAGCDEHKWSRVHTAESWLFGLTITILTIFAVELNIEMVVVGPFVYFRQAFFLADYLVVMVSLGLELLFHILSDDAVQSLIGLLIVGRVWRFVRIGHGIVEISYEIAHERELELLAYIEDLEDTLTANNIGCPNSDSIRKLKHQNSSGLLAEVERHHLTKLKHSGSGSHGKEGTAD